MQRVRVLTASLALGLLLGCAATGTGTDPAVSPLTVGERDALLVDQSFIRIANLIAATPGEPASVVAVAKKLTNGSNEPLDLAQTGLQALLAGTTPPPTVNSLPAALGLLDTALADLAPIAATFGPDVSTAMIAAEILLTASETIAGVPPTARMTAHAAATGMKPETARQTLTAFLSRTGARK